jgi:hypothetical protein
LTKEAIPFSRFLSVWSLIDCCWIQKPVVDADFELMTDYQPERDIMLHIAHHQFYWQQRKKLLITKKHLDS